MQAERRERSIELALVTISTLLYIQLTQSNRDRSVILYNLYCYPNVNNATGLNVSTATLYELNFLFLCRHTNK